jgi:hypothetical protein
MLSPVGGFGSRGIHGIELQLLAAAGRETGKHLAPQLADLDGERLRGQRFTGLPEERCDG